ncbi:hypothetical protein BXZ70DRAFT_1041214 [Cristinia sonorae]|uniref:Uncharacterized protein n=1 Tax=Cristinia sonorae TaxID=1940300 RepID=A0A8K0XLT3_9AGAR|nr:hypothetical protein BXZ70DRAFT_1041214 [Cristinia sonorae]
MRFLLSATALAALPFAASFVINDELLSFCKSPVLTQQSYIGDVKVSALQCGSFLSEFSKRQEETASSSSDVCGGQCTTHCFNPAGGGPDPNHCSVIADALRYDSQDIGEKFEITRASPLIVLQYKSCQSFFVNQASNTNLTYCRDDWAAVIDWVAWNCQAPQNAHGGLCVAGTQEWFIQVQTYVNSTASETTSTATPEATATATATETTSEATETSSSPVSTTTEVSVTTSASVTTETSSSTATETSTSTETSTTPESTSTATETSTSTEVSASTTTTASVTTTTSAATETTTTSA